MPLGQTNVLFAAIVNYLIAFVYDLGNYNYLFASNHTSRYFCMNTVRHRIGERCRLYLSSR